jgi:hypothetical protein
MFAGIARVGRVTRGALAHLFGSRRIEFLYPEILACHLIKGSYALLTVLFQQRINRR